MYVRWKRRESTSYWKQSTWDWRAQVYRAAGEVRSHSVRYSAQLIESHRVDGKPRQRIVAYLGIVREGEQNSVLETGRFWREIDKKLTTLNLEPADYARIVAAISTRAPERPDNEVYRIATVAYHEELATLFRTTSSALTGNAVYDL